MNAINQISGAGGNDIYPVGTYKLSDKTMKKAIYAVLFNEADAVISGVKIDSGNGGLRQLTSADFYWLSTGDLTEGMGYMVFGHPIVEIVIATASVKVFYVS